MENNILFEILNDSKSKKKLIGIWQYGDEDGFLMGYVIDFNEEFVLFQHYTKFGKKDGIMTLLVDGIESIDFDDEYSKAMSFLTENSEQIYNQPEIDLKINDSKDWITETINKLSGNRQQIISLEINRTYYSGYIIKSSKSDFLLKCVGKMGEDEGKVVYRIQDVSELKINDLDDRRKNLLFKWRKASL